jgi:cysteinyl-tRNA synthetase
MLIKARNEKRDMVAAKEAKKVANIAAEKEKKRAQMEEGKVPPNEIFKGAESEYGSWDADGIPLTMKDGSELSKNAAKNVRKLYEKQQKRHTAYLAWISEG